MKKGMLVLILVLVGAIGLMGYGVSADPGTSDDPLVSKSYVDSQIAGVKAATGGGYSVIHLTAGQSVIGKEGTEIIVRAGVCSAIDNGKNGIADLTTGKDVMAGSDLGVNHMFLIPRDDGRGVKAWTEVYLMVRGGYTIK